MSSFVIEGGHKLSGEVTPQGAKNEALQILSSVLLTAGEVEIETHELRNQCCVPARVSFKRYTSSEQQVSRNCWYFQPLGIS